MDIDSSSSGVNAAPQQQQRSIKIHPLAIIGISDHHTRIVSGGSALPPSSPVVGLLFGHYDTTGKFVCYILCHHMFLIQSFEMISANFILIVM